MLTAGDRLLSSALVGRGGCPLCAALVGRVRRWRSSVYALRVYNRQLRLRCLFSDTRRCFVRGGTIYHKRTNNVLYRFICACLLQR